MSKEYDLPSRRELTQRALFHLTQAETRPDAASTIQNALLGIGYAILSNEEAVTRINANAWEIYDEISKGI